MPTDARKVGSLYRPRLNRLLAAHEQSKDLPRVVLVADSFPKYSETFVVNKFVGLIDRGWDVHIVSRRRNDAQMKLFPVLTSRPRLGERMHFSNDMADQIQNLRPQVVNFEFGSYARGMLWLREAIGCKVVVSFRGYDIAYDGLGDPDFYQEVWQEADAIHVVSSDLWHRALSRGCPIDKWHVVITDAIDPTVFDPGERVHAFGVGRADRPYRILSIGRLVWKKGYEYGLQAVAELVADGMYCDYRIVGDGTEKTPVLYAIHDLGLQREVRLLGPRPAEEVRAEMIRADVLLHPSISEGFAVSVIEAQAMELPVVCSDAEGLAENVADGVTGYVVPRRNAQALAAKLRLLAVDPDLRQALGRAGRRRVLERFRIADQLSRFEELYRQVGDVRYRADVLSRQLLGESPAKYPRNEENLLRLEMAYSERAS